MTGFVWYCSPAVLWSNLLRNLIPDSLIGNLYSFLMRNKVPIGECDPPFGSKVINILYGPSSD